MKYQLICIALLLASTIDGWGFIEEGWDDVTDFVEDTAGDVGDLASDAVDTLVDSTVQGASDTVAFLTSTGNEVTIAIIDSIETVSKLTADLIEDIPDQIESFSEEAWKAVSDGAKHILSNLASEIQEFIAKGINALANFLRLAVLPYPLNVITVDDFSTAVDSIDDVVFAAAVLFTQDVATIYASVPLDFEPIFNTKPIEDELGETCASLGNLVTGIKNRKPSRRLSVIDDFVDFFHFDELVISVSVTGMACVGRCATAGIVFAVSTEDPERCGFFYTYGVAIDPLSHVLGGAVALEVGFHPNFTVIPGKSIGLTVGLEPLADAEEFVSGFGAAGGVDLFPDLTLLFNNDDDPDVRARNPFVGFVFDIDAGYELPLPAVVSLAVTVEETKPLLLSTELNDELNGAKRRILQSDVSETDAYNMVESGGYYAKISEDEMVSVSCPSRMMDDSIGAANMVELGAIDIYEVIYGNLEGDNACNSTYGYSAVTQQCLYESNCSFAVNAETLGDIDCTADETHLTLLYGCPNQFNVYNLGCYTIDFWTAVDANWIQDYKHEALDDGWYDRSNLMTKCAMVARENGYLGFGMYNNGMCLMATDLLVETDIHEHLVRINETSQCASNGLGDDVSLSLYAFAETDFAYEDFGCINKTQIEVYNEEYGEELESTFVTFEGQHYLFLDPYKQRRSAVTKCAQIAYSKGFKGFALFDGGKCYLSNSFREDIIQNIWNLTDVDHMIRLSCGKGTDFAYNVFQFPYDDLDLDQEKDGLTTIEIVAIILGSVGVILIGISVYCGYKCWIKKAAKHDFDCQCPICTKANMERQIKSRTPSTQASTNHDAEEGRTGTETEAVNKLKIQELEHQNS